MARPALSVQELVEASCEALAKGNRDEAVELARFAADTAPYDSGVLETYADALTWWDFYRYNTALRDRLSSDGSIVEAINILRRLSTLQPTRPDVLVEIGYCFTALGDLSTAARYIRRAADLDISQSRPDLWSRTTPDDPPLSPDFFVLGVHKGGTTALFDYIADHPLVLPPIVKETEYFLHSERGTEWYLSHFPRRPAGDMRFRSGEASVGYFERRWLPAKLREFCPTAQLIALARNPVDRAISHYYNNRRWGMDDRPLEVAMKAELAVLERDGVSDDYWKIQQGYLGQGVYSAKLENWLSHFPREQLLILVTEEMQRDPATAMVSVFEHLHLPHHEVSNFEPRHEGKYKKQIDPALVERMTAFFDLHNERFYEIIGRKPEWSGGKMSQSIQVPVTAASEARILSLQQRWSEASALWQKCLEDWPEHPDRKDWLIGLGNALLKDGEIDSARAAYTRLAEDFPAEPSGPINLLEIARKSDNQEAAFRWLEACVRRFPSHRDAKWWLPALGHAMLKRGKVAEAEQCFEQATEAYPEEAGGWAGLAVANQLAGRPDKARTLWEDCLKRYPGHVGRRWWLPTYAKFLVSIGERDRAESLFDDMKVEFPDDYAAATWIADARVLAGNARKSRKGRDAGSTSLNLAAVAKWSSAVAPAPALSVGGLLWPKERQLLFHLTSGVYRGRGTIIDAGAFAGASAVCLAEGLKHNPNLDKKHLPRIHSFDRFLVESAVTQSLLLKECGVSKAIDDSFEDVYLRQTAPYREMIDLHKGDFLKMKWSGEEIGILFLDICKNAELNSDVIGKLFPCLMPDDSILIHQDYFNANVPWIHITMEYLSDCFECLVEKCGDSRVYLLRKPVPVEKLERCVRYDFSAYEQLQLMDKVVARAGDEFRPHFVLARAILLYHIHGSTRLREELSSIDPEVKRRMNPFYLKQAEAL